MPLAQQGNVITTSTQFVAGVVDTNALATDAVTAAKIVTGAVDSAEILDGSIVNADISASAAIADSKLAQITTAGKVSGAALTLLANIPGGAGVIPSANLPAADITYTNGTTTKDLSDADQATTVIAHGLGATPKRVFIAHLITETDGVGFSIGSWDSGGQNCITGWGTGAGSTMETNANAIKVIEFDQSGDTQTGNITVDATNITITWTKVFALVGTAQIFWSAEA